MRNEDSLPARHTQAREEGRRPGRAGAEPAAAHHAPASRRGRPLWPPLHEALTAAIRQRVAQRAGRDHPAFTPLVGYICEHCWDAPAIMLQPAPGGGEIGVCVACQQEPHAVDEAPQAE
jgi:hypothetical protein